MSKVVATLSLYLLGVYSAPCVPANQCFPLSVGDSSSVLQTNGDKGVMWTCDSDGLVTKTEWANFEVGDLNKGVCERVSTGNSKTPSPVTKLHDGMKADGSGSGSIPDDYLQGTNCKNGIDASSNSCTEYMVVKRYGNVAFKDPSDGDELAYQNIGRCDDGSCTDALTQCQGKETGTYAEADFFVIPYGCVGLFPTNSIEYFATATTWGYNYYENDDTTCSNSNNINTAQSDVWIYGECATFEETTHCGGNLPGSLTICPNASDGVTVKYDYYFDLVCAPGDDGAAVGTCLDFYGSDTSQDNAPTAASVTPMPTESPNDCPSCPSGGPSGTPSGNNTPSPVTPAPVTPAPVTPSPNASNNPSGNPSGNNPSGNPSGTNNGGSTPEPTSSDLANSIIFIMSIIIGSIFALIM